MNAGSSLLLLLVALFVLWLAVTGRINKIPDAWNLILGDGSAASSSGSIPVLAPVSLPALPAINPATITQRTT